MLSLRPEGPKRREVWRSSADRRVVPDRKFESVVHPGLTSLGLEGFEPATGGLEIRCSVQLSYSPKCRKLPTELRFLIKFGHRYCTRSTPYSYLIGIV